MERSEPLADEMAALVRFTADLDRRLAVGHPEGADGVLDIHSRVRRLLDGVPLGELETAMRDVRALVDRLGDLERTIAAVRKLKALLGV